MTLSWTQELLLNILGNLGAIAIIFLVSFFLLRGNKKGKKLISSFKSK